MNRKIFWPSCLVFVLSVVSVQAQAPATSQVIPFNGTAPGQAGPTDLTFKLYNAATEGTSLGYTDAQVGIAVTDEAFAAVLGLGSGGRVPANIFAQHPSVYIAIELTSAPDVEIAPRVPIYSSGFTHHAQSAAVAQEAQAAHIAETLVAGASVSGSRGDHILSLTNAGTGNGLQVTAAPGGLGGAVSAVSTGPGSGVFGVNTGLGNAGGFAIFNPANAATALVGTTNGTGRAGLFGISNTVNNSDALVATTNGGGSAGTFTITNSANQSDALSARTNGIGNAVRGENTGPGRAGEFQIRNENSISDALFVRTNARGNAVVAASAGPGGALVGSNTSTGGVANFQISNATNSSDVLSVGTNGIGVAGRFELSNTGNQMPALVASTSGSGSTVASLNTGTGRAGEFIITRIPNSRAALFASTNGSGSAVEGVVEGTGATGRAGYFHIDTSLNTSNVLVASTGGGGSAGVFFINSLSNSSPALSVTTNGTGFGGDFQITNSNNARPALSGSTITGSGVFGSSRDGIGVAGSTAGNAINSIAVSGITSGPLGKAGSFRSNNVANSDPALEARTNGSGNALFVQTTGSGRAADIFVNNTNNSFGALGVGTNGSGFALTVSSSGSAASFSGRVNVVGDLDVSGAKNFKIDHPLDPTKKYLYHTSVESPDMKNVYDGVVTLDQNGEAWVHLPKYFEALNRDFRYQLTAIGAPGPNLYVGQEISDNRFNIAGGPPGLKVSWQVTGIRKDPVAEAHRVIPELMKEPENQGKYLNAKEWGQPEALGIGWDRSMRWREELKGTNR